MLVFTEIMQDCENQKGCKDNQTYSPPRHFEQLHIKNKTVRGITLTVNFMLIIKLICLQYTEL